MAGAVFFIHVGVEREKARREERDNRPPAVGYQKLTLYLITLSNSSRRLIHRLTQHIYIPLPSPTTRQHIATGYITHSTAEMLCLRPQWDQSAVSREDDVLAFPSSFMIQHNTIISQDPVAPFTPQFRSEIMGFAFHLRLSIPPLPRSS